MRWLSLFLLIPFFSCHQAVKPGEKKPLPQGPPYGVSVFDNRAGLFNHEDVFGERICRFYQACSDSNSSLDTMIGDRISYNGILLDKAAFISILHDSIKRKVFLEEYPKEEFPDNGNFKVAFNGNSVIVTYDVRYGGEYTNASMDYYHHAETTFDRSGHITAHNYYPAADTNLLGRYKAICHHKNEWQEHPDDQLMERDAPMMYNDQNIYLFTYPPLDLLNMEEDWIKAAAVDSITKNGTIVNYYNSVSTQGDIMNTCILISWHGKKYWTVSESNWLRHEDWDVDTTTDPVTIIHPAYTSANPEVFFEAVK